MNYFSGHIKIFKYNLNKKELFTMLIIGDEKS